MLSKRIDDAKRKQSIYSQKSLNCYVSGGSNTEQKHSQIIVFPHGLREVFSLLPTCLCGCSLSNTMELGGFRKDTYPTFDIPFSVFPAVQYFAIFICGAVYYKLFLILVFLKGIFYRCFPLCTTFSIEFLVLSEQLYWQYPLLYSNMSEPLCL